jgi:hypothetical protein
MIPAIDARRVMRRGTTISRPAPNAICSSRKMTAAHVDNVCALLSIVLQSAASRGTLAWYPNISGNRPAGRNFNATG